MTGGEGIRGDLVAYMKEELVGYLSLRLEIPKPLQTNRLIFA